MVMEAAPGPAFEVIQTEVVFAAPIVLLHLPPRTTQGVSGGLNVKK